MGGFRVGEVVGGGSALTVPFQIRSAANDNLLILQAGTVTVGGDLSVISSRTMKHELEPFSPESALAGLLELPLYRWRYREDPEQAAHVGPMAEDVHAAFGLGRDSRHLSPTDTSGLALAAIQGLDGKLERELARLSEENRRLREQNAELAARLAAVERALAGPAN